MFVSVALPQLVTIPLMVCDRPFVDGGQFLVTLMHGFSVTMQTLVALAVTRVPQGLTPAAVTKFVKLPHVLLVTSLL
jgi:hypothetical protein